MYVITCNILGKCRNGGMVDVHVSGTCERKLVRVQVPLSANILKIIIVSGKSIIGNHCSLVNRRKKPLITSLKKYKDH